MSDSANGTKSSSMAEKLQDRFRDKADSIRQRADLTAKAIGGIGTTVLTAIGFNRFGDVFPLPAGAGARFAVFTVLASFLALAAVIGFFTYRLWRLNEPIVLASNVQLMDDLRGGEPIRVRKIYRQVADLNQAPSLAAYEARAHQLERIAERAEETTAQRYRSMATEIENDVLATEARAALVVIRDRAAHTIGDRWALLGYCAFVVAVLLFALSAAELSSVHAGEIATAKDCKVVIEANPKQLPSACVRYVAAQPSIAAKLSTTEEVNAAVKALADSLTACQQAAESAGTSQDACQPIRDAIKVLLTKPRVSK